MPSLAVGSWGLLKLSWKYPQQTSGHDHVAAEFSDGHVQRAGPKRHFQPARHGTQRVTYAGHPAEQAGLWAQFFQPTQCAVVMA